MKLKFRADAKDVIIFAIFAFFLLYLVALGVINLYTFANFGYFHGLNPFPAFGSKFIITTLTFYILAMVAVLMSVSNKFYDREKGFGFTTKKKEESGYARWFSDKEMKDQKEIKKIVLSDDDYEAAGTPVINNGKEAWVDDGENHSLIIGASGSGKTQCIMHTLVKILAKKGESMIITDPKGEIYEESANLMREKGYKIILINFRDPQNGDAWNPFSYPYRLYQEGNTDKSKELLEDLASNILYDPNNKGEPFWEKSAADYFSGLALGLFEDAKEEEVNLNSINLMATIGEEKIGASTFLKEYFTAKGPLSGAYISASNTINAPADTKGGILSVFRQKIRIFSSRDILSEMLSHSDFDLRDIGRQKTAVFLKIHDEKTTYHALATIFVKQVYESLIGVAQEQENLKLKYRTNFVLDEFANMPPLKDVETMITASRSRNIRFTFVIQNFSQLTKVYGKDIAETIKGNCGNMYFLITTELAALEEISKLCGETKPKEKKDKPSDPIRPLVTVSDLQQMKMFEILLKRFRNQPFKTKFTPNFEINWGREYGKSGYPTRETKPVQTFDVKEFVLNQKREKGEQVYQGAPQTSARNYVPPFPAFGNTLGGNKRDSVDVDDLVKRIDQKIAQLEAEEKAEKEKKVASKPTNGFAQKLEERTNTTNTFAQKLEEKSKFITPIKEETIVKEEKAIEKTRTPIVEIKPKGEEKKPKINVDVDSIVVDKKITDDQFFDDFFGDD